MGLAVLRLCSLGPLPSLLPSVMVILTLAIRSQFSLRQPVRSWYALALCCVVWTGCAVTCAPLSPSSLLASFPSSSMPSPLLWLSASTLSASSTAVSTWPSLVGGVNASQPNLSFQPQLDVGSTSEGRLEGVRFDGESSELLGPPIFPTSADFTLMVLISPDIEQQQLSSQSSFTQLIVGSDLTPEYGLMIEGTEMGLASLWWSPPSDADGGGTAVSEAWIPATQLPVSMLVTVTYTYAEKVLRLYQNGSLVASDGVTGSQDSSFSIGGGYWTNAGSGTKYRGTLTELLLFSTPLNDANRTYIEQNLANAYCIPYIHPVTCGVATSVSVASTTAALAAWSSSASLVSSGDDSVYGLYRELSSVGAVPAPLFWLSSSNVSADVASGQLLSWPSLTGGAGGIVSGRCTAPMVVVGTEELGTLPVVRFNGVYDCVQLPSVLPPSDWTLLVLLASTPGVAWHDEYLVGSTDTVERCIVVEPVGPTDQRAVFFSVQGGAVVSEVPWPISGQPSVLTIQFSSAQQEVTLLQNGVAAGTVFYPGAVDPSLGLATGYYAGSNYQGDIAEVILFPSCLPHSNVTYLQKRLLQLYTAPTTAVTNTTTPSPFPPSSSCALPSSSVSSSLASSSVWSSSLPSTSSPSSSSIPGLVHWLPLHGSYDDVVDASTVVIVQGDTERCASFASVGSVTVWSQSCGLQASPASLTFPASAESGEVTLCSYIQVSAWQAENTLFFSCDAVAAGAVDCVQLWYDATYHIMAARLNVGGAGVGAMVSIQESEWFHLCTSYSTASQQLVMYYNGAEVGRVTVAHSTASYGAPVLGGGADAPVVGFFVNFRVYSSALTSLQVATLNSTDYPSTTVSPGASGSSSSPVPSPVSSSMLSSSMSSSVSFSLPPSSSVSPSSSPVRAAGSVSSLASNSISAFLASSSSSESSSATQLGSGSASWSAPSSISSSVAAESGSAGVQQTTVFQVSSYGAVPDDGLDDYSAIQSALDAAVDSGYPSTLVQLDAGSYNLSACLLIYGANGLTFSGVSAAMTTLVGNAMTCAVGYYTSTNIVLQQFTVDFYPLPFTAGVVSAVTSSSFDLTVVPPHPVMGMAGITTVNDVILYDEVNQRLPLGAVAQIPSGVYFEPGSSSSAVGNSTLRFQLSQRSNLVVGSALIVRYSPSNHAITGGTTSTITLRSVTIQASWCMAHAMQATNVVNIDVHVQPAPGRWLSTNFDGINYNDCRGELSVINSSVISNGDDGLSIHDDGWSIASVSNATAIATSSSYPDLVVGQPYWFSRAATPFSPYAMATVAAYISCSTACSYQLERPGVPDAQVGDWMYSAQPPSLYVYNLTVRNNYARGMLLETANVVVEYSLFDHTYLPGIGVTLGADSTGDYSANVSISNCVFVGCNQGYREWYGQIALDSDPLQDSGVIRNVAITNNTFEMELWSGSVLSDYNGAGVLFQYNFANYSAPDNDPLIVLCNAQGWIIASNTFINVPQTAELYAFVQDTGCVTALSSGGVNTSDAFTACFGPSVVASPYGGGLAVLPSEVEDCNSMSVE